MEKAKINKIIKFSNVDGPGNRMSIFFQGCNYNCLYCHNPETINICNNCNECIKICPEKALILKEGRVIYNKEKCINCDSCLKVCKNDSSPKITEYSVEDLIIEIKKVKGFIRGITVSGGEATLNYKFITKLFEEVKNLNLTTFVDTNGSLELSQEKYKEFVKNTDKFMLDVKAWDKDESIKLTGKENDIVKKNIIYLGELNKLYEVRTVVIPGFLDNYKIIDETSKILGEISSKIKEDIIYKIINYRKVGVREKYLKNEFLKVTSFTGKEIENFKGVIKKNKAKNIVVI